MERLFVFENVSLIILIILHRKVIYRLIFSLLLGTSGAVTVTINMPAGNNAGVLTNAAWEKLVDEFGVDHLNKLADLQMFFIPQGVHGSAYALMPSGISVYGNYWDGTSFLCTR